MNTASGHAAPIGGFATGSGGSMMQQQQPHPHLSHAEPWAHNYICCDVDHNASTSTSTSRPSTPVSRFVNHTQHRSHPSTSSVQSFFSALPEPACCDEPHCPETEVECCTDPACQQGAICEDEGCHFPHNPDAQPGDPDSAESMRELERWACSKEGCHAIQQYLECCTQDDCALPVCTDNHPAPVVCNHDGSAIQPQPQQQQQDMGFNPFMSSSFDTGTQHQQQQPQATSMFDPSQLPPAPWPTASTSATTQHAPPLQPQTTVMPNVCHWQNCHQVFGTTPELLAHIASDHLNAPAVVPQQPLVHNSNSTNNVSDGDMSMTGTAPNMFDASSLNTQPFDLSSLQLNTNTNGVDPLLSCLWDDCFPSVPDTNGSGNMFDMNGQQQPQQPHQQVSNRQTMPQAAGQATQMPGLNNLNANTSAPAVQDPQAPPHGHGHAHGHMHGNALGHSHTHSTGEPFSPQTMLRHVLEEHLGLNPGDLSWTATAPPLMPPPVPTSTPVLPPSISSAATTPVITPIHPVKPHHHHIPILPTPSPSTYTASPPPHSHSHMHTHKAHALMCLWPGCTAHTAFPDTASLMAHLSDEHIGKCKNTYTCLWDTCGHVGGREFKSRQKVLRHLQSHIGHKPYICEVCDQAFSEAAPLAAHKRRHAQEKPFKCDHPGCGKTFAISSSLTIHMRTHNGEKPFVCPHCDKGFVEASNLTKHIRTHTGERPFVCSYPGCEKRFPRPDQLKRHMAIHDADRPGRGKKSRHSSIADLAALA